MKKHKKHVYQQDLNLPCDIPGCGRHFKTLQALQGHLRMVHGVRDPKVNPGLRVETDQVVKSSSAIIEELRNQVETLKLQGKKRQLEATFSSPAGPGDLMSQSGLGPLDGDVKAQAQRRAMGLVDQGPAQSWLDKLLSNPAGVSIMVDGLKGILGVNRDSGAGGLSILKELGIDLKTLWERAQAPKMPQSGAFEVAGINLAGASMTPELLIAVLGYQSKVKAAEAELEVKKGQNDLLAHGLEMVGKAIGKAIAEEGQKGLPHSGNISQEIPEPKEIENVIVCDLCNAENPIPAGAEPGMTIHCRGPEQGPECSRSWILEDPRGQRKRKKEKRPAKIAPVEPATVACPLCGQAINISDKPLGSEAMCPVCQTEFTITSETEPLLAADVLSEEEKRRRGYLQ